MIKMKNKPQKTKEKDVLREVPTVFVENIITAKKIRKLTWKERLVILRGGRISFIVTTRCQHRPGKTEGFFELRIDNPVTEMEIMKAVNSDSAPLGAEPVEQEKD